MSGHSQFLSLLRRAKLLLIRTFIPSIKLTCPTRVILARPATAVPATFALSSLSRRYLCQVNTSDIPILHSRKGVPRRKRLQRAILRREEGYSKCPANSHYLARRRFHSNRMKYPRRSAARTPCPSIRSTPARRKFARTAERNL